MRACVRACVRACDSGIRLLLSTFMEITVSVGDGKHL